MPSMQQSSRSGFTLVEMLVIAPVVIIAVAGFIGAMISITAEVLRAQAENSMVHSTQDALNSIEQDVKLSGAFLAANDLTALSPQGYNDGTGPVNNGTDINSFANVYPSGNAKGNMLILRTFTTDKNPIDGARQPIYTNQPTFSCSPKTVNKLFTSNTIYFVKANILWKRTIIQQGSGRPDLCDVPWQQPSCSPTVAKGTYCTVNDTRMADNVSSFTLDYYTNPGDTTPIADATNPTRTITQRNAALSNATAMRATIATANTVAGRAVDNTASVRATKLNIASDPPINVALGFLQHPTDTSAVASDTNTVFTASATIGGAVYKWQRSTNGGVSFTDISTGDSNYTGANTSTLTIKSISMAWNNYRFRAVVTNAGDTATSNPAILTVTLWGALNFQAGFSNYVDTYPLEGYSTAGYTKTSAGVVMLKGLIQKSTAISAPDVIGILPDGYWPSHQLIFQTSTNPNVSSRVDVLPNGHVRVQSGNAAWVSLEGINYIPAGTSYTRTNLTVNAADGWANYNGSFPPASYVTDSIGRIHTQGLVRNGTNTDGIQLVTSLPAAARTGEYLHLPARSSTTAAIGIDPSSGIATKGAGTNTYMTINALYYPISTGTWINATLQSGWVAYGGFSSPQYIKGSDNIVRLKGLIRSGSTTDGTLVMTLPAGYRPKERILNGAICNPNAYCRIDVLANGQVLLYLSNSGWTSLDSVTFLAEQ